MAVHEEVLAAARRICRERAEKTFRVSDVVRALPHLNPSTVRTHIVSRCCVNAPKNHPHKWDYFKRVRRGEYLILASDDVGGERPGRVAETASTYSAVGRARDTVHVVAHRSAGYFVAEGLELALVTQAQSLDELIRNIRDAVRLHLEGENPADFGLSASPRIVLIYEESPPGDGEA